MIAPCGSATTHWRVAVHGHVRDLALYCGVPVIVVIWWQYAGVPMRYRRDVRRFARMIRALGERCDRNVARALLQLAVRAAEDRRVLSSWRNRNAQRPRYRVMVRS